jgi:hypothetical protein
MFHIAHLHKNAPKLLQYHLPNTIVAHAQPGRRLALNREAWQPGLQTGRADDAKWGLAPRFWCSPRALPRAEARARATELKRVRLLAEVPHNSGGSTVLPNLSEASPKVEEFRTEFCRHSRPGGPGTPFIYPAKPPRSAPCSGSSPAPRFACAARDFILDAASPQQKFLKG